MRSQSGLTCGLVTASSGTVKRRPVAERGEVAQLVEAQLRRREHDDIDRGRRS